MSVGGTVSRRSWSVSDSGHACRPQFDPKIRAGFRAVTQADSATLSPSYPFVIPREWVRFNPRSVGRLVGFASGYTLMPDPLSNYFFILWRPPLKRLVGKVTAGGGLRACQHCPR